MKQVTLFFTLALLTGSPQAFAQVGVNRPFAPHHPRSLTLTEDLSGGTDEFYADGLIVCSGAETAFDEQAAVASSTGQRPLGRFALQHVVRFHATGSSEPIGTRRQLLERERELALRRQLRDRWPDEPADGEEMSSGESYYDEPAPTIEPAPPRQILSMARPDFIPTRRVTTGHTSHFGGFARPIASRVPHVVGHCAPRRLRTASFPATDMQYLLMASQASRR